MRIDRGDALLGLAALLTGLVSLIAFLSIPGAYGFLVASILGFAVAVGDITVAIVEVR